MSVATDQTNASTQTEEKIFRIVVLDNIAGEGLKILESTPGIEYEVHTGLAGEELQKILAEFDGAVCRSGVKITGQALDGNNRLKGIARAGVGTDNIDKEAATRLGIVVMNTPTGNTISTAEQTFALMLGLSRNIAPAFASLQAGKWDRKKFSGNQLHGKTLGVVGLGRIGQEVAKRAKAFGMQVVGYDPFVSQQQAQQMGIELHETVDELLPIVDYLTVHTPLTDETRGLIGGEEIKKIKPGARLINCARGGIYDEEALVDGLRSGQLGGVALDVYTNEPCTDSPLFSMPGVLCTPHLGASTEEAQIQVAVEAVQLLINYLKTGEIKHAVNTIAIDPVTLQKLRGYLNVAYRLGIFLAGWHGGAIEKITLKILGDICKYDPRVIRSAFFAGLLRDVADSVNIVNAESVGVERGIAIETTSRPEHGAFSSVVEATVAGQGRTYTAAGTLFGKDMPRLVGISGFTTDAFMDGDMLVFTHRDVPGVIGYVGQVLADENVNIAQMAVGRCEGTVGGAAIGVLNVDSQPSQKTISKTLEFSGLDSACIISLPKKGELPDWLA